MDASPQRGQADRESTDPGGCRGVAELDRSSVGSLIDIISLTVVLRQQSEPLAPAQGRATVGIVRLSF